MDAGRGVGEDPEVAGSPSTDSEGSVKGFMAALLRDDRGQSMIEYIIMGGVFTFILIWVAKSAPIAVNAYYQYFAYILQSPFP